MEEAIKYSGTRKQLYEEIWEISAAAVARKYEIPYTQFMAQTKDNDIPVPPSGYWMRLKNGKEVEQPELKGDMDKLIQLIEKTKKRKSIEIDPEPTTTEDALISNNGVSQEKIEFYDSDQSYNYYNRQKLYEEVWIEPITEVAKSYHVSDSAIRKVCKSLSIPTPPPDYWSKTRTDGKNRIPNFPIGNYPTGKYGLRNRQWIVPQRNDSIETRLGFLNSEDLSVVLSVADQISITNDTDKFHSAVVKQKRMITNWQKAYKKNLDKDWGRHGLEHPPMNADNLSEEGVTRLSRILDSLVRALEPLGCVLLSDDAAFVINGEKVTYSFSEAKDKIDHIITPKEHAELLKYEDERKRYSWASKPKIRKYDYSFNGKLTFKLCSNKFFRDSTSYQLENRLGEIIIALFEASEGVKQQRLEREEAERKRQEEQRLQEIKRQNYNQEVEKILVLVNEANDFETSQRIRNYVAAAKESMDKDKFSDDWLQWASEKANWFDPTVAKEDPQLGVREHYKNESGKQLEKKSSYWYG